jgi:hypothetical protein
MATMGFAYRADTPSLGAPVQTPQDEHPRSGRPCRSPRTRVVDGGWLPKLWTCSPQKSADGCSCSRDALRPAPLRELGGSRRRRRLRPPAPTTSTSVSGGRHIRSGHSKRSGDVTRCGAERYSVRSSGLLGFYWGRVLGPAEGAAVGRFQRTSRAAEEWVRPRWRPAAASEEIQPEGDPRGGQGATLLAVRAAEA